MYFSDYSGVSCGHFQFLYVHRLRIVFPQVRGVIPVRSWRLAPQLSRVCAQAGAGFAQVIHRCVHREIAVRWPGQWPWNSGGRLAGNAWTASRWSAVSRGGPAPGPRPPGRRPGRPARRPGWPAWPRRGPGSGRPPGGTPGSMASGSTPSGPVRLTSPPVQSLLGGEGLGQQDQLAGPREPDRPGSGSRRGRSPGSGRCR